MNEILTNLLLTVLSASVPIVSAVLVKIIKKTSDSLISRIQSETIANILAEISGRVQDAVASTLQTYVDALKAAGSFNEEAQKEALRMALEVCLGSLSQPAKDYIVQNFGDAEKYLTPLIEAEVKRQKLAA